MAAQRIWVIFILLGHLPLSLYTFVPSSIPPASNPKPSNSPLLYLSPPSTLLLSLALSLPPPPPPSAPSGKSRSHRLFDCFPHQVAALLKGLPLALMEQDAARGEGSMLLPPLAVPHSLMLAVYPGEGARYVAHLDNNTDDPRTSEGPPGASRGIMS